MIQFDTILKENVMEIIMQRNDSWGSYDQSPKTPRKSSNFDLLLRMEVATWKSDARLFVQETVL